MRASDDEILSAALRERGLRVTPQRLLIHRALTELDRHASAEQVLEALSERLPNASLPTVYATLELFEELGIVRRVAASSGVALWDPRPERHHHFVCRRCGAIEDVDAPLDVDRVMRAARGRGLRPYEAELVLTGLCAACSREASQSSSRRRTKILGRSA
jgi:Fur family transcriptional regulator, stress-responsive regulator